MILPICLAVFFAFAAGKESSVYATEYVSPAARLPAAPYAEWAHHHWVWLNNQQQNQANISALVADYQARKITVGAVDLDSGWATGYNNFIVNTTKFENLTQLVNQFHQQNIRLILWATSMVDEDSSNYENLLNHKYYILNAFNGTGLLHWWHGDGLLLDYFNPEAVTWWHEQMDNVLDMGVDGFKTDGTDPYLIEYLEPRSHVVGPITYREYADRYYGDFYNYTNFKRNNDGLIMSRPVDSYKVLGRNLSAYLTFSPHYVMFSGWVGDQDPDFAGLRDALRNMIHSAWHNYTNFGCDIGGYRSGGPPPLGRTGELFTRWFQLGAFVPLMENGGDNEHRPWKFDEYYKTGTFYTDLYRQFVAAHYELNPYLLSTGSQSYEAGISSLRPSTPPQGWFPFILQWNNITDFSFGLGDTIFVVPVTASDANVTQALFPQDNNTLWVEFFSGTGRSYRGGVVQNVYIPSLSYFPVFVKAGAILPLHISTPQTGHGDAYSASALTLVIKKPSVLAASMTQSSILTSTAELRERKTGGAKFQYRIENQRIIPGSDAIRADIIIYVSAWTKYHNLLQQEMDIAVLLTEVKGDSETSVVVIAANPSIQCPQGLRASTSCVTNLVEKSEIPRVHERPFTVAAGGAELYEAIPFSATSEAKPIGFTTKHQQPHWFARENLSELFVRAGSPSHGMKIHIQNIVLE